MSVDAVNERLNGLVTLLQAVGIDALDTSDVNRMKGMSSGGGVGGLPDARQLNDEQIEAIIRKLQMAQAEAPQIIAALEAHAEARSVNAGGGAPQRHQPQQQQQQQQQPQEEDDDEDEEDDEFDEDANYPMVGKGVSDDISVVSDLTTPTVLAGVPVPEEELYKETLPPMMVGGGADHLPPMMINPTKRKNLVSQIRPVGGIAPPRRGNAAVAGRPGGAAAARLKNYQDTMAKLHENPVNMGFVGPTGTTTTPSTIKKVPTTKQADRSVRSATAKTSQASTHSKTKKKTPQKATAANNDNFGTLGHSRAAPVDDWNAAPQSSNHGWDAFNAAPAITSSNPTSIDNDGFLLGTDSFDPFSAGNEFQSAAGDLVFGDAGKDPFSSSASADGFNGTQSTRKGMKTKKNAAGGLSKKAPAGTAAGANGAARPRRTRRASLAH